ncbi:hypothetical protein ACKLNR_009817 [Fusarium oxysporum f. sp. zingiberi]
MEEAKLPKYLAVKRVPTSYYLSNHPPTTRILLHDMGDPVSIPTLPSLTDKHKLSLMDHHYFKLNPTPNSC